MKHEIRRVTLAEWEPAPYNPRTISDEALAGLGASLDRFGLVEPLVVNARTKRIVGGHQRARALKAAGETECDAVIVDLAEAEERALNVTLNNPKIAGDWTGDARSVLDQLEVDLGDAFEALELDSLRDSLAELFPDPEPEPVTEDEVPEPPSDPVTKLGDAWTLGDHRLVCGDSTDAAVVKMAIGRLQPFIMVTDPPYGVEYDPEWRDKAAKQGHLSYGARAVGRVLNDNRADWSQAWALFPGDVVYTWSPGGDQVLVTGEALQRCGFLIRSMLMWKKASFAISRGAYHYQHEPCWYAVRKGKKARWCGGRSQSSVWEISHRANETGHGTQKPVECMARPMRNHGVAGDVVYDPFVGSGTSLVAAEHVERRCVAIELDPGYCDVAVERWQNLTGGKATR